MYDLCTSWSMDCWRFERLYFLEITWMQYSMRSSEKTSTVVLPQHVETTSLINIKKNIGPQKRPLRHSCSLKPKSDEINCSMPTCESRQHNVKIVNNTCNLLLHYFANVKIKSTNSPTTIFIQEFAAPQSTTVVVFLDGLKHVSSVADVHLKHLAVSTWDTVIKATINPTHSCRSSWLERTESIGLTMIVW